jgi:two-component system, OmpR family, response regulator
MRVLLVEDDELVADAVIRGLTAAGFSLHHAGSAEAALGVLGAEHFDLAILDIGLPGADGLSLVKRLRTQGSTLPILVLTAHYALQQKIKAFDLGADDFLMKPFEQAELAVRCRALLRRAGLVPSGSLKAGRLRIDLIGHRLLIDDQPVELTRREWAVLETLAHNVGRIVTKERLLQSFTGWEQDLSANAVETHVSRLRAKLADAAIIRTVRGLGYRLEEPGSAT